MTDSCENCNKMIDVINCGNCSINICLKCTKVCEICKLCVCIWCADDLFKNRETIKYVQNIGHVTMYTNNKPIQGKYHVELHSYTICSQH